MAGDWPPKIDGAAAAVVGVADEPKTDGLVAVVVFTASLPKALLKALPPNIDDESDLGVPPNAVALLKMFAGDETVDGLVSGEQMLRPCRVESAAFEDSVDATFEASLAAAGTAVIVVEPELNELSDPLKLRKI